MQASRANALTPMGPQLKPHGDSWRRIIVVSNRLPFKAVVDESGERKISASAGGLVTAMTPLLHRGIAGKWVGWSGADEEEGLEEALRSEAVGQYDIGAVTLTPDEEARYYEGYSNQVLAPFLVGEPDKVEIHKAISCRPVYDRVQAKFAEKICEDLRETDIVWVQDYHLTGVARELRNRGVRQPIGFFLHTPFPRVADHGGLPGIRRLIRDILVHDIVGFQTLRFEQNFLNGVHRYIPEARVIARAGDAVRIVLDGHATRIGHFAISIDPEEFERQLYASDTQRNIRKLNALLRPNPDMQLIFNVGRQDYTKGFREELWMLGRLLERYPQFIDRVTLSQLVIPSRGTIVAHRDYKDVIRAQADELNAKFRRKLVHQMHRPMARARYLAHLNVADVQNIPTLSDGMNLVAKESAIVGHPMTVMLLGRNAGVAEEFGEHAIIVDPEDTEAYADAMFRALVMRDAERHRRKSALKAQVTANDIFGWWQDRQEPLFQAVWNERRST